MSSQKVTLLCERNMREIRDNITKDSRIIRDTRNSNYTNTIDTTTDTKKDKKDKRYSIDKRDNLYKRDIKEKNTIYISLTRNFFEGQDWQFLQCFVFRRKLVSRLEGFEVCKDLSEFSAIVFSKL